MRASMSVKLGGVALLLSTLLLPVYANTRYIAHRGESVIAPENTMPAFELAAGRGANGFECDVYLTADNQIVCIHDSTTTRTTDDELTVASSTLTELRELDAGSWKGEQYRGTRIPTLAETLKLARDDFEIYVEVKSGTAIVPYLKEIIEAEPRATPERVLFIAFNQNVIAHLRQQLPAYRAYWLSGLSTDENDEPVPSAASVLATLQNIDASGIDIQDNSVLTSEYVEAIKSAGYSFHVWTVNTVARGAALAAMGVDTVTSDNAVKFTSELGQLSAPLTPLIHWTFDDNNATNLGYGGPSYDAILKGSEYAFVDSLAGQGLYVFGDQSSTRGYAEVSHVYGNQGTVAFWYKPDAFYNHNSLLDNSAHKDQWEFWIYDTGRARFRINSTSADLYYYTNLTQVVNGTNAWYHFAITWDRDAGTSYMYVNGACVTNAPISGWSDPGSKIFFGGGHSGNTAARGTFDDVRVYNESLCLWDIKRIHAEVAALHPVVHLPLDGTATNTGTGGSRYDGTINGNDVVWTNGVNNKGLALDLDGESNFVEVPYRLSHASGTIALWCYLPEPWYNYNSVFDNSGSGDVYECWVYNDGRLAWRPRSGAANVLATVIDSNRWYHIACTWDRASAEYALYLNGEFIKQIISTNSVQWRLPGTKFYLGGGHKNNSFGTNTQADAQIFETALTAQRVKKLYNDYIKAHGELIAYLPLDGTLEDVVGNHPVVAVGDPPTFVKTQIGRGISYDPTETPGTGGNAIAISNVLGSCDGTISFWFYARGPFYNYIPLFENLVHNNYWEGWIAKDSNINARVTNLGSGAATTTSLDNLDGPDRWYHFTWVWNLAEARGKLYIDGVLRKTAALRESGWVDPDPTLYIGSIQESNRAANGIWDEVRVYNRALTDEEVAELAIILPPPPPRGTILLN